MKNGISMTDAAIFGNSANRLGVIDAPTATPRMVLAATEICPNPAIGA